MSKAVLLWDRCCGVGRRRGSESILLTLVLIPTLLILPHALSPELEVAKANATERRSGQASNSH